MNLLEKYGIKEVCDVTFYEIDSNGQPTVPVLYLDTLKVSTVEQTAENVSARGGKGNPELVSWDYGKEITLNLEDALFSAKSMAMMFGTTVTEMAASASLLKTLPKDQLIASGANYEYTINNKTYTVASSDVTWYTATGATTTSDDEKAYGKFYANIAGAEIVINSDSFPGTYYVTGDTYARSSITGKDEFFQLVIPKAKMQSEVTLTMEAEGDPSTFSMNMRVLRPDDKKMMKLIKYDIEGGSEDED